MEFNSLGYFQFNNLIEGRIPLLLVLLDEIDINPWYNSMVRMHLQNVTVTSTVGTILETIQKKNLPMNYAVVVLDINGEKGAQAVKILEDSGYTNAYYVKGGYSVLAEERNGNL